MTKLYDELKEKAEKCRARNNAYEYVMLAGTVLDNLPAILSALKNDERYQAIKAIYSPFTVRNWPKKGDYVLSPDLDAEVDEWIAAQSQEDRHG